MRQHRASFVLLTSIVLSGLLAGSAGATTVDDLIKLKNNKTAPVSDDVLVALIESDGSVFHLTADDIVALRAKGLSDKVIIAMLLTATRTPPPDVMPPADVTPPAEAVEPIAPVPQPIVINLSQDNTQTVEQPQAPAQPAFLPIYIPVAYSIVRRPAPAAAPVYWGWGGQRRPDSYLPAVKAPVRPAPGAYGTPKRGGGR